MAGPGSHGNYGPMGLGGGALLQLDTSEPEVLVWEGNGPLPGGAFSSLPPMFWRLLLLLKLLLTR